MRRVLPIVLNTKFEAILAQERALARAVASAVIGDNPVGVWDVVIPLVFLYNLLRFRRAKEIFALNFLFTKRLALDAAFDMIDKGQSKEAALAHIGEKTNKVMAADKKGLYSEKIRQRQMQEIDLLLDHYCKLLRGEGKGYGSLLKNAYPTREDYTAFLERLKRAEKEVNRAAKQTVGTGAAGELVPKMEKATESLRAAEVEKTFGRPK